MQDNFLKQVVTEPTKGDNILDLALTNNENMISEVDVGSQLGCSDHREIRFNLEWEVNRDNSLTLVHQNLDIRSRCIPGNPIVKRTIVNRGIYNMGAKKKKKKKKNSRFSSSAPVAITCHFHVTQGKPVRGAGKGGYSSPVYFTGTA